MAVEVVLEDLLRHAVRHDHVAVLGEHEVVGRGNAVQFFAALAGIRAALRDGLALPL